MNPYHTAFLHAVLKEIGRETLVLKGGMALILAYRLERTSSDLDFDSERKVSDIETKIRKVSIPDVRIISVDLIKDTSTSTRYRVQYNTPTGKSSLKIEVSYRNKVPKEQIRVYDGIRVAAIERILDQKLLAAHDGEHPRTKARDLYDIDFIANYYTDSITKGLAKRLSSFASDPEILRSRYEPAFEEDDFDDIDVPEIALRLHYKSQEILRNLVERERGIGGGR